MTIGAAEPLTAAVLGVTESQTEGRRISRGPAIGLLIVTDSARGKVASFGLRVWSMATVALLMR